MRCSLWRNSKKPPAGVCQSAPFCLIQWGHVTCSSVRSRLHTMRNNPADEKTGLLTFHRRGEAACTKSSRTDEFGIFLFGGCRQSRIAFTHWFSAVYVDLTEIDADKCWCYNSWASDCRWLLFQRENANHLAPWQIPSFLDSNFLCGYSECCGISSFRSELLHSIYTTCGIC